MSVVFYRKESRIHSTWHLCLKNVNRDGFIVKFNINTHFIKNIVDSSIVSKLYELPIKTKFIENQCYKWQPFFAAVRKGRNRNCITNSSPVLTTNVLWRLTDVIFILNILASYSVENVMKWKKMREIAYLWKSIKMIDSLKLLYLQNDIKFY